MVERYKENSANIGSIPSISTSQQQAAGQLSLDVGNAANVAHTALKKRAIQEAEDAGRAQGKQLALADLSEYDTKSIYDQSVRTAAVEANSVTLINDITQETKAIANNAGISVNERIQELQLAQKRRLQNVPPEAERIVNTLYSNTGLSNIIAKEEADIKARKDLAVKEAEFMFGTAQDEFKLNMTNFMNSQAEISILDGQLERGEITPEQHGAKLTELNSNGSMTGYKEAEAKMAASIRSMVAAGEITPTMGQAMLEDSYKEAEKSYAISQISSQGVLVAEQFRDKFTPEDFAELVNKGGSVASQMNAERERIKNEQEAGLRKTVNKTYLNAQTLLADNQLDAAAQQLEIIEQFANLTGDQKIIQEFEKLSDDIDAAYENGGVSDPDIKGRLDLFIKSGVINSVEDVHPNARRALSFRDQMGIQEQLNERSKELASSPVRSMAKDQVERLLPIPTVDTGFAFMRSNGPTAEEQEVMEQRALILQSVDDQLQTGQLQESQVHQYVKTMIDDYKANKKYTIPQGILNRASLYGVTQTDIENDVFMDKLLQNPMFIEIPEEQQKEFIDTLIEEQDKLEN